MASSLDLRPHYAPKEQAPTNTPYNKDIDRTSVYNDLLNGKNYLFYGPGGVGKTHEMRHIEEEYRRNGGKSILCAFSNSTAQALGLGAMGIYQAFGLKPDNDNETVSKLLQLCVALRRCNKAKRNTDQYWDRTDPTKYDWFLSKNNKPYFEMSPTELPTYIASHNNYELLMRLSQCPSFESYASIFERLRDAKILFIEEIFMVGSNLFNIMNTTMQLCKNNRLPFGGCSLLLCGDAMQNIPINDGFIFHSELWKSLSLNVKIFKNYYRFANSSWIEMLSRIRIGKHTVDDIEELRKRIDARVSKDSNIELTPTRDQAAVFNKQKLQEIWSPPHNLYHINATNKYYQITWTSKNHKTTQPATDEISKGVAKKLFKNHSSNILPDSIELCVGARVINIWNDHERKIYNGNLGYITDIRCENNIVKQIWVKLDNKILHKRSEFITDVVVGDEYHFPDGRISSIISIDDETVVSYDTVAFKPIETNIESNGWAMKRINFPLELAWALTIHKMQGVSAEFVTITINGKLSPGQAYTGLSRCSTIENLIIRSPFDASQIITDQTSLSFNDEIMGKCT